MIALPPVRRKADDRLRSGQYIRTLPGENPFRRALFSAISAFANDKQPKNCHRRIMPFRAALPNRGGVTPSLDPADTALAEVAQQRQRRLSRYRQATAGLIGADRAAGIGADHAIAAASVEAGGGQPPLQ